MTVDRPLLHLTLLLDKCEDRGEVIHHRRNGHLGPNGTHALMLRTALLLHARSIDRVTTCAVVEIGQQHVIADRSEPARHILELLANAVRVHQQEDSGERAVALGMADESLHLAVFGRDVQGLFDHGGVFPVGRFRVWPLHRGWVSRQRDARYFAQSGRRYTIEYRESAKTGSA